MYMYIISFIVVSLIVAYILQVSFRNLEVPGGYWNRLLGSAFGAIFGDIILGDWGWMVGGYNVIAGVISAFVIGGLYIYVISKASFRGHKSAKTS